MVDNDLLFLLEKINIRKYHEPLCNQYDENSYIALHKIFKTSIKSWINISKVHKAIKFNEKACLKCKNDIRI